MVKPTNWQILRKNLKRHEISLNKVSYKRPACYIIGIKPRGGREIHSVYVGKTGNLYERIQRHANWDSATALFMENTLRRGYQVYFCYYKVNTERKSEIMEKRFLKRWWDYPWNVAGMPF